jgi:hypothetical protein
MLNCRILDESDFAIFSLIIQSKTICGFVLQGWRVAISISGIPSASKPLNRTPLKAVEQEHVRAWESRGTKPKGQEN